MKQRDKNKRILIASAILIVVSILITTAAFIYEKSLIKDDVKSTSDSPTTQYSLKESEKSTEENKKTDTTKSTENTTKENIITGNNKPGTYKVTTKDTPLGIRTKPLSNANRCGDVPKGSEVKILATYNGWGYYHTDTTFGWLSLEYLELVSPEEVSNHSIGKYKINVDTGSLYIREEPEQFTAVRGNLSNGEEIEILTVAGDWGYIEHSSGSGWVPFKYLEKVN